MSRSKANQAGLLTTLKGFAMISARRPVWLGLCFVLIVTAGILSIKAFPYVTKHTGGKPPASVPRYNPGAFQSAEIEREVATHRLSEQSSNVRFNDFRIPQAATIVLREAGQPLHVSEIYRRMADGGFEFRGQHQLITLAVSLSRSKRFRKVAPGTFELDPEYLSGQAIA